MRQPLFATALFAAALAVSPSKASDTDTSSYWVTADITIAPDGSITALQWHDSGALSGGRFARLEPIVRGWKFQPGMADGRPAVTDTTLTIRLDGHKDDDGNRGLVIGNAYTGVSLGSRQAPAYPEAAIRRDVSAKLRLELAIDAQGTTQVKVVDYFASDDRDVFRRLFEEAAKAATREWEVRPERVAGHVAGSRWRVPITFCINTSDWCRTHALPSDPDTGDAVTPPGGLVPLDSASKVLSEVGETRL